MTDKNSEPEVFKANPRQVGTGSVVIMIIGVFIVCEFIAAYLNSIGLNQGHIIIPMYVSEIGGLPIAAIAGYLFYLRIKAVAPAKSDEIRIYSDHLEIQKQGNVRTINFNDITNVEAITNKYGIIFLQMNIADEIIKIVGMIDMKGIFESFSRHLPPSKVGRENFLQAMRSEH